jgi:transposase
VLTLLEFRVRRQLEQESEVLEGLYPDQPKRTTLRPTAEKILKAFEGITLTVIEQSVQVIKHLTPLNALQHRILQLLACPGTLYSTPFFQSSLVFPER